VLPLLVCGNAYSAYCEDPSEAFCGEETFCSSGELQPKLDAAKSHAMGMRACRQRIETTMRSARKNARESAFAIFTDVAEWKR